MSLSFVDRGDPSTWDWTLGSFTFDGLWHMLDCSAIVPVNTKIILFHIRITAPAADRWFELRKNGNVNERNVSMMYITIAGKSIGADMWCACDSTRKVQYQGTTSNPTSIFVSIGGWVVPIPEEGVGH